jgi:hypothetical protein
MVFRAMSKNKDWSFLKESDMANILPAVNDIEPLYHFSSNNTIVQSCQLDFYGKNIRLLRLTQDSWRPEEDALWYIDMGDGYIINLDGDVSAIHEANANTSFKINSDVLRDYLKFRLFFEIRHNSRTLIVDDVDILELQQTKNIDRVSSYIHPVSIDDTGNDDNSLTANAVVHYKNQLYTASYEISKQGVITEQNRTPLPLNIKLTSTPKFSL